MQYSTNCLGLNEMSANKKTDALLAEALGDVWRLKKEVEQLKVLLEETNKIAAESLKGEIKDLSAIADRFAKNKNQRFFAAILALNLILSSVVLFKTYSNNAIDFYEANKRSIATGIALKNAFENLDESSKQKIINEITKKK